MVAVICLCASLTLFWDNLIEWDYLDHQITAMKDSKEAEKLFGASPKRLDPRSSSTSPTCIQGMPKCFLERVWTRNKYIFLVTASHCSTGVQKMKWISDWVVLLTNAEMVLIFHWKDREIRRLYPNANINAPQKLRNQSSPQTRSLVWYFYIRPQDSQK
jgi:hypothetical protein